MTRILFIFLVVLGVLQVVAQQPQALLQADTGRIRMGEQLKLTLSIFYSNQSKKASVQWPVIADSLLNGKVIVVDRSAIDTSSMSNEDPNAMMQRRSITITSFDSATYALGPFGFVVNGDSIFSNTITFDLITFEVDTTQAIKDIKEVIDVPFTILDWLIQHKYWILIGVGILVVVFLALSYLKRKRKQQEVDLPLIVDTRSADEIALQFLEEIRRDKRWITVSSKHYYTELTDVLRSYIEKRFEVLAFEQTTSELIGSLRFSECSPEERQRLNEILSTADLVKFARQQPDEQTALVSLDMAIKFVENTRIIKPSSEVSNAE